MAQKLNELTHRRTIHYGYDHQRLEKRRSFLRFLLGRIGFPLLAKRGGVEGVENLPAEGPAILMINHRAFIDSLIVLDSTPRNIVPLAKVEVYDYPVIGIFPKLWEVIPVRREDIDRRAIQQCMDVLKAGEIILVAPEGTRHPVMHQGKVGVAYLASRTGAPVIPVAVEGSTEFPALRFTSPWKGPGARVRFGRPIRYRAEYQHASKEQLRQMTDEAMYVLSALLSPEVRGYYADLSKATQETIELL